MYLTKRILIILLISNYIRIPKCLYSSAGDKYRSRMLAFGGEKRSFDILSGFFVYICIQYYSTFLKSGLKSTPKSMEFFHIWNLRGTFFKSVQTQKL